MPQKEDINKEGHTREWQDRARVELDAKKAAHTDASPKQSPIPEEGMEDVEEKSERLNKKDNSEFDPAY